MSVPPHHQSRRVQRWVSAAVYGLLAFLAYVPFLLTAQGKVTADSKQYLFLDPGRLLARAPYLWHPEVHLGTVTHQNIGYLFPAGPWFWAVDRLGVPDWVAQRLWLGTILFVAGTGMLYLMRTLAVRDPGRPVAAFVYMLSPYTLVFASRLSVLLLAWSVLPWILALTIRALRSGDWRAPAGIALLVQVGGSITLTAIVLVGIAPVLWILYATTVTREVTARRALAATGRIAVLSLGASLWWLAALSAQAGYGLNILEFSETVNVVAIGGQAGEVLRGLGNWFFYGGDSIGNWIEASIRYTTSLPLIFTGYLLVGIVFVSAAVLKWEKRGYFVILVVVGVLVGVGVHPYDDPSPFGRALKSLSEGSSVGMALRNVGRIVPLVALGGAVLVGAATSATYDWLRAHGRRTLGAWLAFAMVLLAVVNLPTLWDGGFYGKNLLRPEEVPDYWYEAIADLDARGEGSRILELPGADFAAYTWGNAVEPITPGLTDRPYVARELIPYGSAASANLLKALDRRVQMGQLEPQAIAPLARLLSVGDIVLRSDLQSDRFDLVRPRELASQFSPAPSGTSGPARYGQGIGSLGNTPLDERALADPNDGRDPAPVEVYRVDDPRPLLDVESGPGIVVSGDGDGIIDLAAVGLLDADPLVRYSAAAVEQAEPTMIPRGAALVVTDTNRRRAQRWNALQLQEGFTERAGEKTGRDTYDHRLDVFPKAGDDARTVAEQRSARVTASGYGSPNLTYIPADRPARAVDGDVQTAWRAGRFAPAVGEWLRIVSDVPVETGEINLVQPLDGERNRFITKVRLEFRDREGNRVGDDVVADLGPESRTAIGQTVTFPARRFAQVDLVVEADSVGPRSVYLAESGVGFAEVRIPGLAVDEVVRLPVDLVDREASADPSHPLVYVMTRLRNWISIPNISEEESALVREIRVPTTREFGIAGQARIAGTAPDDVVDALLGYATPAEGGIAARSSDRIRTTLAARASSAFDGDTATAWQSSFDGPVGQWIEVDVAAPITFGQLGLHVVTDGRHSVPTRIRVDAGGESRTLDLPALFDNGATQPVPLEFEPLTASRVRITVEDARVVGVTKGAEALRPAPVSIAEVGLPGVIRGAPPAMVPADCVAGLLAVDGNPVPVQLTGTVAAAEAGRALDLTACPADAAMTLAAGSHILRTAPGAATGVDIDRLVLASAAGGDALVLDGQGAAALSQEVAAASTPEVRVTDRGRTRWDAQVTGAGSPFVLVLGESFNAGWKLTADGKDLGRPQLVDGYANGWVVDPGPSGRVAVSLDWTPQRRIWIALGISALAVLACVVLLLLPRRGTRSLVAAAIDEPVLSSPLPFGPLSDGLGVSVGGLRAAVVSIGVGGFGAVFAAPWVGLVAGVLTAVALRWPRWRWVPSVAAIGAVCIAGLYVVLQQHRYRYPAVIEWPTFFDRVHTVALAGVVLLAADVVIRVIADRVGDSGRPGGPPAEPGDDGPE